MKQKIWIALLVTVSLIALTIIYLLIVYSNNNTSLNLANLEKTDALKKEDSSLIINLESSSLAKLDTPDVNNLTDIINTSTIPGPSTSTKLISKEVLKLENNILYNVPFTSQAPSGDWSDIRLQNACEEASVLMAISWAQGKDFTADEAEEKILAMAEYQLKNYGHFHDTSAQDTLNRIIKGYFNNDTAKIKFDIETIDIKNELARGNIVIIPVDGRKLQNPYFTPPGPIEHMIVVIGFDYGSNEFIVNDPGTKRGNKIQYSEKIISEAMQDYPSGYHLPIEEVVKAMIIISPS